MVRSKITSGGLIRTKYIPHYQFCLPETKVFSQHITVNLCWRKNLWQMCCCCSSVQLQCEATDSWWHGAFNPLSCDPVDLSNSSHVPTTPMWSGPWIQGQYSWAEHTRIPAEVVAAGSEQTQDVWHSPFQALQPGTIQWWEKLVCIDFSSGSEW